MTDGAKIDVTDWVASLSKNLQLFDAAYLKARDEGDWGGCVLGYIGVLAILKQALASLPLFHADLIVVSDLMLKLDEVVNGNNAVPPVPRGDKGGRPPEGYRAAMREGRAAAGVEILVKRGLKETQATEFVAKNLRKFGVVGRQGRPITLASVRDWRSKVSDETAFCEKPDARLFYQDAMGTWGPHLTDPNIPLDVVKRAVADFCAPSKSSTGRLLAHPRLLANPLLADPD